MTETAAGQVHNCLDHHTQKEIITVVFPYLGKFTAWFLHGFVLSVALLDTFSNSTITGHVAITLR